MSALIETMRLWQGHVPLWPWHQVRLERSAQTLAYALPLGDIQDQMRSLVSETPEDAKIRLLLHPSGLFEVSVHPIVPLPFPYRVGLSPVRVDPEWATLYHKTTARSHYRAALAWAGRRGLEDGLLHARGGTITEASFANVLAQIEDEWWTPPVADGLLPGVMRSVLMEAGLVRERHLSAADLAGASRVCLCNAVRGVWPVVFVNPSLPVERLGAV